MEWLADRDGRAFQIISFLKCHQFQQDFFHKTMKAFYVVGFHFSQEEEFKQKTQKLNPIILGDFLYLFNGCVEKHKYFWKHHVPALGHRLFYLIPISLKICRVNLWKNKTIYIYISLVFRCDANHSFIFIVCICFVMANKKHFDEVSYLRATV